MYTMLFTKELIYIGLISVSYRMFDQNKNNERLIENPYGQDSNTNNTFPQNNFNPYATDRTNPNFPNAPFDNLPDPNQNYPQFANVVFNSGGNFGPNGAEDFAAELNPLLQQKGSKHIQTLIATIILIGGQGAFIGLYLAGSIDLQVGPVAGIAVGIYLFYLIVALCCNSLGKYLSNLDSGSKFYQVYDQNKQIQGKFVFSATCYHYQTRYHTRTVNTQNGTKTQHYTTQQKVITHSASQNLVPSITKDDSGNVDQVRAMTNIIFVNYKIGYKFADSRSENFFHDFYAHFRRRNYRDVHQDYNWTYALPSFEARRAFFIGEKMCNFRCWFYVSALFGMVWPFSLWVESLITRYHIQYMKILSF